MKKTYRVHMGGYGDGYDDYETMEEAEQAAREWCAAYGEGEAQVEAIEERRTAMRKTYWHKHPRNFANECDMVYATTKAQREDLEDMGYERLTLKEAREEIRYVNRENESWGSNRAFGVMRLAAIEEHVIDPWSKYAA